MHNIKISKQAFVAGRALWLCVEFKRKFTPEDTNFIVGISVYVKNIIIIPDLHLYQSGFLDNCTCAAGCLKAEV